MLLIIVLWLMPWARPGLCSNVNNYTNYPNSNRTDKDLYVIHATVYQVGILTNRTDNSTDNFNSTGNIESVTLYHTNGSNIDFSRIPEPLLTNVTAQSIVGVAPAPASKQGSGDLNIMEHSGFTKDFPEQAANHKINSLEKPRSKRSNDFILKLFKRAADGGVTVKMVNGTAVIPPEAAVRSIALPPLLSLNNNLSNIPVPIPNTSVVHYAKVNTLIQKP